MNSHRKNCLLKLIFPMLLALAICLAACTPKNIPSPDANASPSPVITAAPTPEPYTHITVSNSEQDRGQLALVNYQYKYNHTAETQTMPIPESSVLLVDREDIELPENIVSALLPLAEAFNRRCGDRLYITSGYRTEEYQSTLYSEYEAEHGAERAAIYVAQPGASEHHTGLAVDLSTLDAGGQRNPLAYHEAAAWFDLVCTDYGFILRYPVGTEAITHVAYEPWHFRYVGAETAHAVAALGMTYEEYMEHIKQYSIESGMLFIKDEKLEPYITSNASGELHADLPPDYISVAYYNEASAFISMESSDSSLTVPKGSVIWYVPASSGETTDIAIPSCITEYFISGTNSGGFIIIGNI